MNEKLTIYFNKRTGTIKELCSGEQDMSWFGDEKEDYEQIYDFVTVDYDGFILENLQRFKIIDGELKLQQESVPDKYL